MSEYSAIKAIINQDITTNGQGDITGSILNQVLKDIVDSLGAGYQFFGVATSNTNPGNPDQKCFYIAFEPGTYQYFGNINVPAGISILKFSSSWSIDSYPWSTELIPGATTPVGGGALLNYLSSGDTNNATVNGFISEIYDPNNVLANAVRFRLATNSSTNDRQFWVYNSSGTALLAVSLGLIGEGVFYSSGVYFYIKKYREFDQSAVTVNSTITAQLQLHPNIFIYKQTDDLQTQINRINSNYGYRISQLEVKGNPTNNVTFNSLIPEIYDPGGRLNAATRIQINILQNGFRQIFAYNGDTTIWYDNIVSQPSEWVDNRVLLLNNVYFFFRQLPSETTSYYVTLNASVTNILTECPMIAEHINDVCKISQKNSGIAWYGTSIPAGSETQINFTGFAVSYLRELTTYSLTPSKSQNAYPALIGSLLGANVYNHAVGSSTIAKPASGSNLELRCKALANSIQDICDLIAGCYYINWNTHNFDKKTNNPYGVTSYFNVSNWDQFMAKVTLCLSYSYEVSMICHHLIPAGTAHDAFITAAFGTHYSDFVKGVDIASLCAYRGDVDVFAFDHGWNDSTFSSSVDSDDPTTFYGAYNLILSKLFMYKAGARAVIISDYIENVRCDYQRNIAKRWGCPFAYLPDMTPCITNVTVKTQGYWDNNHNWINSGFTWSISGNSYTSNNTFFGSKTLAQVQAEFNPEQINGVWVWTVRVRDTWLFDTVHPYSDNGARVTKVIASALAEWLINIGTFRLPVPQRFY